jgi:hypothetical protein
MCLIRSSIGASWIRRAAQNMMLRLERRRIVHRPAPGSDAKAVLGWSIWLQHIISVAIRPGDQSIPAVGRRPRRPLAGCARKLLIVKGVVIPAQITIRLQTASPLAWRTVRVVHVTAYDLRRAVYSCLWREVTMLIEH